MKHFFLMLYMLSSMLVIGQSKYLTKIGSLSFEASVPSFEEVAAQNKSVTAILNTENGEFAALALVKAFRFKNALMEEHFNENYAESDLHPKTTFKGLISDFELEKISALETSSLLMEGQLTFHGVTKNIDQIPITMKVVNDSVFLSGNFSVLASDYNIEIPKIVKNKLSNEVLITFNFQLIKK
ncbi:YceI family protein [uncultured Psychroserpens sp.]|uniref:YceI family protein n=1 Tax=uncultured Psychroserpens sp. TaxID=255436 RepID=UPI0026284A28|nr:YceI family protein [uncultured Psychroserpens sp.]